MQNPIKESALADTSLAEIQVFENSEFGKVRTVRIDNETYFVGKDIAEILGFSNSRKAIADHVDDEDKGVTNCYTPGGKQNVTIINESGLYSLILGSKLESAKKFKHWVTSEVLPSIRKTGGYNVPKTYAEALQIAANQAKQIEEKNRQIAQMKPSADSWETYAGDMKQRSKEKSFRDVAKLLGLTPQKALIKWFFDNAHYHGAERTRRGTMQGYDIWHDEALLLEGGGNF